MYVSVHYMYTCSLYIDTFYISTALKIIVNYVVKCIMLYIISCNDMSSGKDDLITILAVILLYIDQKLMFTTLLLFNRHKLGVE